MTKQHKQFVFIQDNTVFYEGTKEEIAERTGLSLSTIKSYSSPSYVNKNRSKPGKPIVIARDRI